MKNKYDVIIVGGGTAGVSCAWNSAKRGLKTLIVEKNTFLGGSITSSLVVPAMKTSDNAINTDFFSELYSKLAEIGGAITYIDKNKGWFNPELTQIALDIMMNEVGVDVLFESYVSSVKVDDKKILSACIVTNDTNNINSQKDNDAQVLLLPIETKYLVDSTGDAKICEKLNCNFLEINENNFQPSSLRFIMSGVNSEEFSNWIMNLDPNRDVTTSCIVDGNTYFSTAYTWDTNVQWALKPLFKQAVADNILKIEDTNYFQLFSVAGTADSVAFNAPRLLNISENPYTEGRLAILRLANFCKKYLPGFKKAHISSIANSLGIRVSRRVEGEYIYTYEDLINGKTFETPVLVSNYPVDIHSDKKDTSVLQKVNKEYQLPLEALKVKGYKNLYVIGRCISADFKAQAALRIIPSCFSMGEGLAKYFSLQNC